MKPEKTIQERLAAIPDKEKAMQMFLIKKRQQEAQSKGKSKDK